MTLYFFLVHLVALLGLAIGAAINDQGDVFDASLPSSDLSILNTGSKSSINWNDDYVCPQDNGAVKWVKLCCNGETVPETGKTGGCVKCASSEY